MSFAIKLQNSGFPINKLEKNPNLVTTVNGTLRNETEVVDPIILIEMSEFPNCNYLTIDAFNRSYFIREVRAVRNNIWEVHAHVDVLMSFKEQILGNRVLVCRNENKFDLYLNDGVFKAKQNSRIGYLSFPNGFSHFNYILLAAGGASQNSNNAIVNNQEEGEE